MAEKVPVASADELRIMSYSDEFYYAAQVLEHLYQSRRRRDVSRETWLQNLASARGSLSMLERMEFIKALNDASK